MKVFKFGGASVKSAEAVKNAAKILSLFPEDNIIVVVSAMGKMTNAFESLLKAYFDQDGNTDEKFKYIKDYHLEIIKDLFADNRHPVVKEVGAVFNNIEQKLQTLPSDNFDFEYDQLIPNGEILSTLIISAYMNSCDIDNEWIDARSFIKTDSKYRDANVDWDITSEKISAMLTFEDRQIYITQGFIGSTMENISTTLGREGSDYSAAIIAYCKDCRDVTIWKDVPGVLNADPKWFDQTVKIDKLSYYDAIELAYYGASVIHPKTIKPLQNKKIPLFVKSFLNPLDKGTIVTVNPDGLPVPSFIFKVDQVLITISPKDFSFILESNLRDIFHIFAESNTKINVMQNTALSFSVSIDYDERKFHSLIESLSANYKVKYNSGMELVTIRHYDDETIERVTKNKDIWLEEKTKHNIQIVMRNK